MSKRYEHDYDHLSKRPRRAAPTNHGAPPPVAVPNTSSTPPVVFGPPNAPPGDDGIGRADASTAPIVFGLPNAPQRDKGKGRADNHTPPTSTPPSLPVSGPRLRPEAPVFILGQYNQQHKATASSRMRLPQIQVSPPSHFDQGAGFPEGVGRASGSGVPRRGARVFFFPEARRGMRVRFFPRDENWEVLRAGEEERREREEREREGGRLKEKVRLGEEREREREARLREEEVEVERAWKFKGEMFTEEKRLIRQRKREQREREASLRAQGLPGTLKELVALSEPDEDLRPQFGGPGERLCRGKPRKWLVHFRPELHSHRLVTPNMLRMYNGYICPTCLGATGLKYAAMMDGIWRDVYRWERAEGIFGKLRYTGIPCSKAPPGYVDPWGQDGVAEYLKSIEREFDIHL